MNQVKKLHLSPQQMQATVQRATENAKTWAIWKDKPTEPERKTQMNAESTTETTARATHTPGPWEVVSHNHASRISAPIGDTGFLQAICHVYEKGDPVYDGVGNTVGYGAPREREANAALIAAAPELLAACRSAQNWLHEYITQLGGGDDPMNQGMVGLHNQLVAAIAKAAYEARLNEINKEDRSSANLDFQHGLRFGDSAKEAGDEL